MNSGADVAGEGVFLFNAVNKVIVLDLGKHIQFIKKQKQNYNNGKEDHC